MLIPKSFILGGTTFEVEYTEALPSPHMAKISFTTSKITIANTNNAVTCSNDCKEASFFHELVHGILATNGYSELSSNETLVEGFANSLHQFFKTVKYEENISK